MGGMLPRSLMSRIVLNSNCRGKKNILSFSGSISKQNKSMLDIVNVLLIKYLDIKLDQVTSSLGLQVGIR